MSQCGDRTENWRGSYDDWLSTDRRDVPNAEPVGKLETCEHCGRPVAAVSVARCVGHFSDWPARPERKR